MINYDEMKKAANKAIIIIKTIKATKIMTNRSTVLFEFFIIVIFTLVTLVGDTSVQNGMPHWIDQLCWCEKRKQNYPKYGGHQGTQNDDGQEQ